MKYSSIIFLIACVCTPALINAQALGGVYTVANGNPGGTFDYADIGDIFNDLEDFGVNAPVTVELHDVGGPFVSKESYQLGFDGDPVQVVLRPITGISASNALTIRAAQGQHPVILGGGAASIFPASNPLTRGGLSFTGIGHTTVEGLEITGGAFGIHWFNHTANESDYIRIARCRIHGITQGSAIGMYGTSASIHNVTIANNMFWNCTGPGGQAGWGIVCTNDTGGGWVVRNNTVVHVKTNGSQAYEVFYQRGDPWALFSGNVVYLEHASSSTAIYNGSVLPINADNNVFHIGGLATISTSIAPDWATWQGLGFDQNGLNTDPQLMSVAVGQEDLRLRPDSPAIDLIPASALTTDVFGNPRPYGSGYDSGAHEVQNHGARVSAPAGSAFSGPVFGPFDMDAVYGDSLSDARIALTDPEADTITVLSITSQTPAAAISTPAVPAPGQPLMLEWTGIATDPPGTYTWTIEYADAGNGFALTCNVNITINPPPPIAITTLSLPAGTVGSAYNETILTADATGAITFSLQSGALPAGLALDAGTGTISGTPTQDGMFTFTIQAADSFNTATQAYDVTIYPAPPPLPPTKPPDSSGGCANNATGGSHASAIVLALLAALAAVLRHAALGNGGKAEARATGGDAVAVGGDSTAGGNGGGADAGATGHADSQGGQALGNGNGGDAWAWSSGGDAIAVGGDSTVGGNGGAVLVGAAGHAEGRGGHALGSGNGGDATIWWMNTGSIELYGGNGAGNGRGGDALAGPLQTFSVSGTCECFGGSGAGAGRGGHANAESTGADATAEGGSAVNGDGGNAAAIAFTHAMATGGDTNPSGAIGNQGGNASAMSNTTTAGAYTAAAYGGEGNYGGIADADVSSSGGSAFAQGGFGVDPSSTPSGSEGGPAFAYGVSGSSCHAIGGNAAGPGLGNGGTGEAVGPSTTVTVPNTGYLGGDTGVQNWP